MRTVTDRSLADWSLRQALERAKGASVRFVGQSLPQPRAGSLAARLEGQLTGDWLFEPLQYPGAKPTFWRPATHRLPDCGLVVTESRYPQLTRETAAAVFQRHDLLLVELPVPRVIAVSQCRAELDRLIGIDLSRVSAVRAA